MDSVLKIKYFIYDIFGNHVETDSYAKASTAFKNGKIVYEVHETTWSTQWVSGKNDVRYEWHQPNAGE